MTIGLSAVVIRLALVAVLALVVMPLSANTACACVCDRLVPREAARDAATVFTGVARGRVPTGHLGVGERVEFAVETVYKGASASRAAVTVEASSCGYIFTDGERYTVFATADGRTNLCMGNVHGTIDPATYGVDPIVVYPSQLIDLGRTTDRVAVVALLVMGLIAAVWVRVRRSWSV